MICLYYANDYIMFNCYQIKIKSNQNQINLFAFKYYAGANEQQVAM